MGNPETEKMEYHAVIFVREGYHQNACTCKIKSYDPLFTVCTEDSTNGAAKSSTRVSIRDTSTHIYLHLLKD